MQFPFGDPDWLGSPGSPLDPNISIIPRWEDPRPDLIDDHNLWVRLLRRLFYQDKDLWGLFHALRCGGSTLIFDGDKIVVELSQEWDLLFRAKVRAKYLHPKAKLLQEALDVLATEFAKIPRGESIGIGSSEGQVQEIPDGAESI